MPSRDKYYNNVEKLLNQKKLTKSHSIVGFSRDRAEHDFYPTPPEATLALLQVEKFKGRIWEPACGKGHISKVLKKHGYKVRSTDLIDRGYGRGNRDFLKSKKRAPNIITNPPFSLAQAFIEHALAQSTRKVAMFGKIQMLESIKRKHMFENSPLKTVYVFSKRITLYRNGITHDENGKSLKTGGGMMSFCWFVWEHGYIGKPTIAWI